MLQSNYYSVREIKLIASGAGGRLLEEIELYRCAGTGIRFFRGQSLPGHQASGGNFLSHIRFLVIF